MRADSVDNRRLDIFFSPSIMWRRGACENKATPWPYAAQPAQPTHANLSDARAALYFFHPHKHRTNC